ncbi:carboxypeptidase-like regulatory domain-containing protein [Flavobacterium johnsoniae]|uniref:TonB-dependent receptor n=1 Tax=Flavobacterium johnsoniae (strain ATCC 17061 / DSM 2064 / JCM 8514 / BCRC 14874 / CCUG 350202 / NBRC 14942 / NCIMB 11054 / UW101) TaxID=376686 RepID=A5FKS4_FLAJ1|nr:carboxypeptidase-like regulatory domain-containing protein [Flavobacterium johnsoniae]ABQ04201.1 TonB-dependent receptor [Flavobacterium johnsoniae UW101]OXG02568.1 TonB-dependent receptor [Flavobacterium johnsoniae UW101]WQG84005.1 carboxypeptidase-like regulatory domain-containing protein [Flavobacterium johnsoniae UW101]SHK15517.1 CarboxypepD_reg-like domain-containing protein [Flavobacterium johnsoniae]
MVKKYAVFLILWSFNLAFAQQEITVTGIVIDARTQNPLENVVVTIQNTAVMQLTSKKGKFELHVFPTKEKLLLLRSQGYKDLLLKLQYNSGENINLGILQLEDTYTDEVPAALITLSDNDFSDDNSSSEMTSGLLQSSRDAFMQASAFNWGQARFRMRGLDSENGTMMLNGMTMNKIYDGRPQWNNWGGLNNVLRNQEFSVGNAASNYTFGGVLGTQQIFTQASLYRKGTQLTFSGSNASYTLRAIGTYASGMSTSGWAYVVSAGKRWADEGYFEGTNFDADSFFMTVEKKLNSKHSINFTGFYTPNSRGKNSPNTNEVTALMGEKYNSYWGFQNGKRRNARVKKVEEPLFMLNHYFKIDEKTKLNSGVMYQFGKVGNSNIDYQNADSPDPVYYRKMPSYFSSLYGKDKGEFSGDFTPDYENADKSRTTFLANSQIDWNAMYLANQKSGQNGYEPSQSHYVLYEDRTDDKTFAVNSNLNTQLTPNISFDGGVMYRNLKSHNFQYLLDLLGGKYFEDIDPFYKGDLSQSDLQNPNRQVKEGDIYGYNYNFSANTIDVFTQFKFSYNKTEFYLAQSYSMSNYQREGLYQNGLYPTASLGKSEKVNFENFGFKGGFVYKVSGKQWLFFNAAHLTRAPSLRNTFANSRLNNNVVNGIESENVTSAEANYVYSSPKLKLRLTAYYTLIKNSSKTSFFYAEGIFDNGAGYDPTDAFVSQTLTKLDKKNTGAELSFEYQITSTLKSTLSAAYGNYIYNSNPNVSITNDANASKDGVQTTFDFGKAYLKNYKQSGTPQNALSLGLEYRDPKFWWIGTNINYLTDNYIDVSPISRTSQFYINPANGFPFPEASSERGNELLKQEKFDPVTLLNINGGKSWRVHKKYIGLFASVNNVLNAIYKTGGFEQARNANFRALNQDVSSGTPSFGPKYYYGYGRTYFLNLTIGL